MTATITVLAGLYGELLDEAWNLYDEAFRELNTLTVQRHWMDRKEFDEVMQDPRLAKYLCRDGHDNLCGMSTLTNDLDAAPLISPAYFQRRWPRHYAASPGARPR